MARLAPTGVFVLHEFHPTADVRQLKSALVSAHHDAANPWEHSMSIGTILLIILILALVGVLPTWGHSRSWGYGPSGVVGLIVVVLIVLLLLGRI